MSGRKLDRVVWEALTTRQSHLAEGDGLARRYPAAMAPFAATLDTTEASFRSLSALIPPAGRIALVTTEELVVAPFLTVVRRDHVCQMVRDGGGSPGPSVVNPARLGSADLPDMLALAEATQPGPFGPRTIEIGNYLGLRRDGRLVAMAGERMKLDGLTEVSAVCVNPAFRGQGFAAAMTSAVCEAVSVRGEVPFLHVFQTNTAAIALYSKIGFVHRRMLHLTVLARSTALK